MADSVDGGGDCATSKDPRALAEHISIEMSVPMDMAETAVYSTLSYSSLSSLLGAAVRSVVLNAVSGVPSDMNVDDARAILLADREDEKAEEEERRRRSTRPGTVGIPVAAAGECCRRCPRKGRRRS